MSELPSEDETELQEVSKHTEQWKKVMNELKEKFTKKGFFGLRWDSKVPENKKWILHFFTITSSNKKEVLDEIVKYEGFYENMHHALDKIKNFEEWTDAEKMDPDKIVRDLNNSLKEMVEAAESGKNDTPSSEVYNLHESFLQNQEKIKSMIRILHTQAYKEGFKTAKTVLTEAEQSLFDLNKELQNIRIAAENSRLDKEQFLEEWKEMATYTKKMAQIQEQLQEKVKKMEENQEKLQMENEKMKEQLKAIEKSDNTPQDPPDVMPDSDPNPVK